MSDDEHAQLLEALEVLERLVEDRTALDALGEETRRRFLMAAGQVSRPDRDALRQQRRARRRNRRDEKKRRDEEVLHGTGIRALRREPVFVTPPLLASPDQEPAGELIEARKCYVCKAPFAVVHHFYDQMCPPCAELNYERRYRSVDLSGRVALVTGARVKIGYQAAIKLLRAGAKVIVTTRFPHDAQARYAQEADFGEWRDRLVIHGLDLRHTPSVEAFCQHLTRRLDRLDFILNNACQTVRRPPGFYRHLMEAEEAAGVHLFGASSAETAESLHEELALFVDGELDQDRQQIDRRDQNSWRLKLDEVPTIELLEVQLVNAVAPYVINGSLRALMNRTEERDKHIVNVSAMEGQFYREFKTDRHPHTNMAKAALNMMTRTSASDYVRDGIHMNSVDTGWITDEDPLEVAKKKVETHGFHPPLDIVDGAARIVDPIFDGFETGEHMHGLFLKDYRPIPW